MTRAIIYARVSSDEQAKESHFSIATQLDACRQYAESAGMEIVGTYRDDFTGTVPIENRPEGSKAYALFTSDQADALIVYRMDRLGRPKDENDEWNLPPLIRSLAKTGKEIHTVNRGRIGTSFADLLLAMLDSKVAGDERRAIIERTMRGRTAKARAGKVVGTHPPLYGYAYSEGAYIVKDDQARVVRQIFDWYTGRDNGVGGAGSTGDMQAKGDGKRKLSMYQIVMELNARSIPPPGTAKSKAGSRKWYLSAIHVVLHNRAYIGEWSWAGNSVAIPPIIERAQFELAQDIAKANLTYAKRNSDHEYLLRGMIYCMCGCRGKFHGQHLQRSQFVYRSLFRSKRLALLLERTCNERMIRADIVETAAWHYAVTVIDKLDIDAILLKLVDGAAGKRQAREARVAEIDAELADLEDEADKLAGAIGLVGGVVGKKIQAKIDVVNKRHNALTEEKEELANTPDEVTPDSVAELARLHEELARLIDNPTSENKRYVFERMRLHVDVKNGFGVITSIFPWTSPAIDLHKTYIIPVEAD